MGIIVRYIDINSHPILCKITYYGGFLDVYGIYTGIQRVQYTNPDITQIAVF